jgi:hypothetical protein
MPRLDSIARLITSVSILGLFVMSVLIWKAIPPPPPSRAEVTRAKSKNDYRQIQSIEARMPVYGVSGDVDASIDQPLEVTGGVSLDGPVEIRSGYKEPLAVKIEPKD